MSYNLSFPILGSWKATLLNWGQKLKLVGSMASTMEQMLAFQNSWVPEVVQLSAGAATPTTGNWGMFISPEGSRICIAIGRVNYNASLNHEEADVTLPRPALRVSPQDSTVVAYFVGTSILVTGGVTIAGSVGTAEVQGKSCVSLRTERSTNLLQAGGNSNNFAIVYQVAEGGI